MKKSEKKSSNSKTCSYCFKSGNLRFRDIPCAVLKGIVSRLVFVGVHTYSLSEVESNEVVDSLLPLFSVGLMSVNDFIRSAFIDFSVLSNANNL